MKNLRVLILSPASMPSVTGNSITTERWRQSLERRGSTVRVLATQGLDAGWLLREIKGFQPDLIHAYHAFHCGVFLLDRRIAESCRGIPVVVSLPGTDANLDAALPGRQEIVFRVCNIAQAVISQSVHIVKRLRSALPNISDRIIYVPKASLWFGDSPFDLRSVEGFSRGQIIFFLPAGIRPVKGNLECLVAFEKVHHERVQARIVFAGDVLDAEYGALFREMIARSSSFACWVPSIPPAAMRSAYGSADVVLNCSFSEGLSNVLLEAISAGKPILASDIPNNRWLVQGTNGNGPCGILYDPCNPDQLFRAAVSLIDDEPARRSMEEASRRKSLALPTPDDEAGALIEVYERVTAETSYKR